MIYNGFFLFFLLFSFVLTARVFSTDAVSIPMGSSCLLCHQSKKQGLLPKKQPECQGCHDENPLVETSDNQKGEIDQSRGQGPFHVPSRETLLTDQEKDFISKGSPQEPVLSQEMVYVPEGPFLMGNNGRSSSEGAGNSDEQPLHSINLKGYWIDRYETTNAMYDLFVKETGHRIPKHWLNGTFPAGKGNHPVVYVDWNDAVAFCRWAGKRLPTEPEWEKAARGTDGRVFPWGNQFDIQKANTPQRWLSQGKEGGTLAVGSFESGKSPYGLYDMAGNVYEWTSSWYQPYPGNTVFNMHYGEINKVLRGGSWYDCLSYGCGLSAPSYNRTRFTPKIRNKGFGFRCAKSELTQ
jgi:formylglycine-generating enzyme required for sulfatase activity